MAGVALLALALIVALFPPGDGTCGSLLAPAFRFGHRECAAMQTSLLPLVLAASAAGAGALVVAALTAPMMQTARPPAATARRSERRAGQRPPRRSSRRER